MKKKTGQVQVSMKLNANSNKNAVLQLLLFCHSWISVSIFYALKITTME